MREDIDGGKRQSMEALIQRVASYRELPYVGILHEIKKASSHFFTSLWGVVA